MSGDDRIIHVSPRAAVEAAVGWVLGSRIQEVSGEDAGAFRSWHDPDNPGFLYAEVTGYGVTALCGLDVWRDLALERARLAARWLLERARRGRACACRKVGGELTSYGCSFDNGVILRGLCALYARTREGPLLKAVRDLADWLVEDMKEPSGFFIPRRDLATGLPHPVSGRWSSRPGPHQGRLAFALLHAAKVVGEERWVPAATRLCEAILDAQEASGRFVTDGDTGGTYLHAHAYAVEGLAACGAVLDRDDLVEAARRGLRWACGLVDERGALPARYDPVRGEPEEEHSDAIAQVLRLVLLLEGSKPVADLLATRLIECQCQEEDLMRWGGFRYARRGAEFGRNLTTHGTLFAIQALRLYGAGTRDFEWWDLI